MRFWWHLFRRGLLWHLLWLSIRHPGREKKLWFTSEGYQWH